MSTEIALRLQIRPFYQARIRLSFRKNGLIDNRKTCTKSKREEFSDCRFEEQKSGFSPFYRQRFRLSLLLWFRRIQSGSRIAYGYG